MLQTAKQHTILQLSIHQMESPFYHLIFMLIYATVIAKHAMALAKANAEAAKMPQ